MTAELQALNDTVLGWSSDIPGGWSALRLKWLVVSVESGVSVNATDQPAAPGELGVLKTSAVYEGSFVPYENKAVWSSETDRVQCPVRRDTVIMSRMNTPSLVAASAYVERDYPELFLPDRLWQISFDGKRAFTPFMARVLSSAGARAEYSEMATGTSGSMKNLAQEDMLSLIVPLPSLSQQRVISSYLDRETARLDSLIAAKQRLLVLLEEKRRALITRAITRGLNPSAQLRDSGIPWLGKIPAHWEIKRLKWIGEALIGLTFDPADVVNEEDGGVLVLRASNVFNERIVLDDNVYVKSDIPRRLRTRVGDILICSRSGSRALIGKNAQIDEGSAGLTFGAFMTVFRSEHNDYLFYVFNSTLIDYQSGAFLTSTINQLTVENLYSFEVPMPPPDEQKAIVRFLAHELDRLRRLSRANERTIALLKERRAALISSAVMGQIEVEDEA